VKRNLFDELVESVEEMKAIERGEMKPGRRWKVARTDGRFIHHRLPTTRPPTHPGVMAREEFLRPARMSGAELARRLGISVGHCNAVLRGERRVTPATALGFAQVLRMAARFWDGLQGDRDAWNLRARSANR
jgi:antitoxin HigA-1